MIGFIDKLASAIATAEGFFAPGDPLPKHNHNPGDLRAAPDAKIVKGFAVALNDAQGIAWLYRQLLLMIARGWPLRRIIFTWAPEGDGNNSENYYRETCRRVGVPYFSADDAHHEPPAWTYLEIHEIK